jgi:hypothetical protein
MKHSYRIALAGFATLLGSSTVSIAAPATLPQGVIVSALSQSQLNSILRDIQKGASLTELQARYNVSAADLTLLQTLAANSTLDIDNVQEFRQELRSLIRDLRSGLTLQQALAERGITLTAAQSQQLLALAGRLGIDVSRVTDRLEKFEQKAERQDAKRDRNETQPNRQGASAGAPYGYAYGYREKNGLQPLTGSPGRRNGQMIEQPETTGALRGGPVREMGGRPETTGLGRANEVTQGNERASRGLDRATDRASENAGGMGGATGGQSGGPSGNSQGAEASAGSQGQGHGGGEGGGKGHK